MSDAYVIQVSGFTAGIVTRETEGCSFHFFSAAPRFSAMEGQHFSDPLAAEHAARKLTSCFSSFAQRTNNVTQSTSFSCSIASTSCLVRLLRDPSGLPPLAPVPRGEPSALILLTVRGRPAPALHPPPGQ